MATDTNKSYGLDDQNSIINQGNQGSLQDGTNKSEILDDLNYLINQRSQGNQAGIPKKDEKDEDIKEKVVDTTSEPAEEHLITEADDLYNNDQEQNNDESSFEDPDQGPEEIDPVNHPRDFQIDPEDEPQRPSVD